MPFLLLVTEEDISNQKQVKVWNISAHQDVDWTHAIRISGRFLEADIVPGLLFQGNRKLITTASRSWTQMQIQLYSFQSTQSS